MIEMNAENVATIINVTKVNDNYSNCIVVKS
jgi:hypothetical protein